MIHVPMNMGTDKNRDSAMAGLLVSVRDAREARIAMDNGARVIDVKEPNAGALGAASPRTWRDVARVVNRQLPCSIALGELCDTRRADRIEQLPRVAFAKLGLARCADDPNWACRWRAVLRRLPPETIPVAVVYADWQQACAPCPEHVLRHAVEVGCGVLLCDTYHKDQGGLMDYLSRAALARIIKTARGLGLRIVLAGSLQPATIPMVLDLSPDLIAVRGAVCAGGRTGAVEAKRVRALARLCMDFTHIGSNSLK